MTKEEPHIDWVDYTSINFPSDRLTIRDLRCRHPDLFDVEGPTPFFDDRPKRQELLDFEDMIFIERLVARMAYQKALGKMNELPVGVIPEDHEGHREDLMEFYKRYGLASGPQHARQLIRDFEAQAAAQAKHGPDQAEHCTRT